MYASALHKITCCSHLAEFTDGGSDLLKLAPDSPAKCQSAREALALHPRHCLQSTSPIPPHAFSSPFFARRPARVSSGFGIRSRDQHVCTATRAWSALPCGLCPPTKSCRPTPPPSEPPTRPSSSKPRSHVVKCRPPLLRHHRLSPDKHCSRQTAIRSAVPLRRPRATTEHEQPVSAGRACA